MIKNGANYSLTVQIITTASSTHDCIKTQFPMMKINYTIFIEIKQALNKT